MKLLVMQLIDKILKIPLNFIRKNLVKYLMYFDGSSFLQFPLKNIILSYCVCGHSPELLCSVRIY
jgi:hypothetical protein